MAKENLHIVSLERIEFLGQVEIQELDLVWKNLFVLEVSC